MMEKVRATRADTESIFQLGTRVDKSVMSHADGSRQDT